MPSAPSSAAPSPSASPSRRAPERRLVPSTLRLAGALTVIEGLGVLVVTGWLVVGIVREHPAEAVTAWGAAGLLGLFGAGVVFAGRGVLQTARWSRAPTAVTQLLLIAVSVQFPWVGVVSVLVVLAVVTGVLLVLPPSTHAFVGGQGADPNDAQEPDSDDGKTPAGRTR